MPTTKHPYSRSWRYSCVVCCRTRWSLIYAQRLRLWCAKCQCARLFHRVERMAAPSWPPPPRQTQEEPA